MIKFRHQNIRLCYALFFFLVVKKIAFTWAADGSSSSTRTLHNTRTKNADAEIWTDVNLAIDTFIGVYESQNNVTLNVNRELKPTNEFEAGLGLLCATFRLEFTFHGQDRSSVIVKVPKLTGSRYHRLERMLLYEKEKFMYEKVFPLMYRPWPNDKLTPQLHLVTEKSRILFLENLHENGFRTTGNSLLDSPEMCKRVMESLAQFHALSAAPLKEENDLFHNLFERTNAAPNTGFSPELSFARRSKFEKYVTPTLTPRVKDFVNITHHNREAIIRLGLGPSKNHFNVILHGDPNRSNVFFPSHECRSEGAARCKFVDFYYSRVGSPVIDLLSYLLTSVQFEVFKTNEQMLFNSYVHEFGETVLKGRKKYDLPQLYADLQTYKSYFVYKLIFDVPVCWRNTEGMAADNEENLYDEQVYSSERYQTFFKNWMEYLIDL